MDPTLAPEPTPSVDAVALPATDAEVAPSQSGQVSSPATAYGRHERVPAKEWGYTHQVLDVGKGQAPFKKIQAQHV